jgi:penicillin-binding protein-related factor A (putative recombinase)
MNSGKIFEKDWKDSIPSNTYYLRIVDAPSSWGDNTNLRFSVKNPFDSLMYIYPNLFLLELKSAQDDRFSFKGSSVMIKEHQIKELTKAAIHKGVIPGFLFNCRKNNQTYFLHINDFNKFTNETDKSSINKQDIIKYGAIEVIGKIKKVKYKWYVGEFITEMQKSLND